MTQKEYPPAGVRYHQQDDTRECTFAWRQTRNGCMAHYHEAVELHYVETGGIRCFVDGTAYDVNAGEMLLIPSYSLHFVERKEGDSVLVAVVPLHFVPSVRSLFQQNCFSAVVAANPPAAAVRALRGMCSRGNVRSGLDMGVETLRGLTLYLLGTLMDEVGLSPIKNRMTFRTVHAIVDYLQTHYRGDVSMETLAQAVGYSPSRLSHLFREYFRCSFTEYMYSLRCREAMHLMRQTDSSILEICHAVGFNNVRSFYRAFQRIYGCPPQQMKAKIRHNTQEPQHAIKGV